MKLYTNKHTHAPWQLLPEECDKPYIRIRGTVLGSRFKIANVLTPHYDGVHPREAEETRANARLIASAPELLDVCEQVITHYSGSLDFQPAYVRMARAAIAKVRGEA